jgi:hypothetical protein
MVSVRNHCTSPSRGRNGFHGKNKQVSLGKTDGFLGEGIGDDDVCYSVCKGDSLFSSSRL